MVAQIAVVIAVLLGVIALGINQLTPANMCKHILAEIYAV
jgi:hypothetical protein